MPPSVTLSDDHHAGESSSVSDQKKQAYLSCQTDKKHHSVETQDSTFQEKSLVPPPSQNIQQSLNSMGTTDGVLVNTYQNFNPLVQQFQSSNNMNDSNSNMLSNNPYFQSSYGMPPMGMYGGGFSGEQISGLGHPGITNFLFSVQSVVFSLGQTMQIISMNSQALSQMCQSTKQMIEQAVKNLIEFKSQFENFMISCDKHATSHTLTNSEQDRKRRRKLKAIRWTLAMTVTFMGYKLVRYAMQRRRRRPQNLMIEPPPQLTGHLPYYGGHWNGYARGPIDYHGYNIQQQSGGYPSTNPSYYPYRTSGW